MATAGPHAIRTARPDDADALSDLARRSKAYWGYPVDFLARVEPDLTITAADIEGDIVRVLESPDGRLLGFYRLILGEPAILEDLWLEPGSIGEGLGRRLWRDAMSTARTAGAATLELDADPHAVPFYERMGAVHVGETASRVEAGRRLPRMRIAFERAATPGRAATDPRSARASR